MWRDLLTYAHNQIWGPHSVPTYTPYTPELVVAGSKAYRNDQLWKKSVESHLVKHIQSCYKIMSFLGFSGFFIMAAVLRDVVRWANKLVEVLEHVLGIKKYKNCFGKFDQEARQISLEPRKMELLLLTAVAPASGIGHANKLAEVVDQVLGVKKPFYSFGKLGREPLQRSSQKSDTPKFATSRPHREPGNRPRAQTLLFLQKARPEHGDNGVHVSTSKEAKNRHVIIFPFGVSSLGRTQKRSRDHFWRDVLPRRRGKRNIRRRHRLSEVSN